MRALQIEAVGRSLVGADLPDPTPSADDVVIAVEAAGICRSDVHYRAGTRAVPRLPLIPGHEVAGRVVATGADVDDGLEGKRVCVHYLVSCGQCDWCARGAEQFCETGAMVGLDRAGGYADFVMVPARNPHLIPDGVPTEIAAIMMCSTATSLHALRKGRMGPGDRVAVFGVGGLGTSAIHLAAALGAAEIYAVDINPTKLSRAAELGATPVDATLDPVGQIREATGGGVDIALELVGDAEVMRQAVGSLGRFGRAVAVGITHREFGLDPFRDLVLREAEVVGASDHLDAEIAELLAMAAAGTLDLSGVVTASVPLEIGVVNAALDALELFGDDTRTVIRP
jgi:2-desacetyl-2-hydroxyethyl bacteriochlorophyllide A dehydrogenase